MPWRFAIAQPLTCAVSPYRSCPALKEYSQQPARARLGLNQDLKAASRATPSLPRRPFTNTFLLTLGVVGEERVEGRGWRVERVEGKERVEGRRGRFGKQEEWDEKGQEGAPW